ncbi:MAG: glycosyltransferase family 2 protein [Bacteroidetes bacterium]|nr:glycosyltransferase family 2 protein [Bacteroidota bacterium]
MTVSIIIVNYNGSAYTRQCLESLTLLTGGTEVIVVDNASTDGSKELLPQLFPSVRFHWLKENRGFGFANNRGAEAATGDLLFFLNNDTVIQSDILPELTGMFAKDQQCGIVAPKLLNRDGTFQLSFGDFPVIRTEMNARSLARDAGSARVLEPKDSVPVKKDWVTGAALLIRRGLFSRIGGFDERFFMYFEDSDLCRRVSNTGHTVWYCPAVSLIHFGGSSYGKKDARIAVEYRRSQLLYYRKHNSILQRVMLALFLIVKHAPRLLQPTERKTAWRIIYMTVSADVTAS